MEAAVITAVGIDVSKSKSTVAVRRPGGEIALRPFEVHHTNSDLKKLASTLKKLGGDIRIVMEHTSTYWRPIALTLKEAGFFVSVVNAMLIHDFSDNTIRKLKTDRADALKIANYALTFWDTLPPFNNEEETRLLLKMQSRANERITATATALRNGLIALADQTFPGVNIAFDPNTKNANGHEKWVDFFLRYWHKDCVCQYSMEAFTESYRGWCKRKNYKFRTDTAHKIYLLAQEGVATLPKCESTKMLITQACKSLNAVCEAKQSTQLEMQRLATMLPEYEVVMQMEGAGPITGPALMAEIGDVRRFNNKKALVAFAGIDAQACKSLNAVCEAKQSTQLEMQRLATMLPEYEVVMQMEGAGPITGPALMAEIGDVRRFKNKKALVAFAGIDAPPFQSGAFESKSLNVSKRGSPHLRRTIFIVSNIILTRSNPENAVYCFMDKKRSEGKHYYVEGKHYYVYTVAGSAKFLRVYYARVTEFLRSQPSPDAC